MHFKSEDFDLISHPGHKYELPAVAMRIERFKVLHQILKYFRIFFPLKHCLLYI